LESNDNDPVLSFDSGFVLGGKFHSKAVDDIQFKTTAILPPTSSHCFFFELLEDIMFVEVTFNSPVAETIEPRQATTRLYVSSSLEEEGKS
jgi:hypothetical protein